MKNRNICKIKVSGKIGIAVLAMIMTMAIPAFSADVSFTRSAVSATGSPEDLHIYRMAQPKSSKKFEAIAKLNGVIYITEKRQQVSAEGFKEIAGRYAYSDDQLQLSASLDGTELYFTDFVGLKLTEPVNSLPSDEEAVKLAYEFLDAAELMTMKSEQLRVDHVGGIMQALAEPGFNYKPEKKAVVVYFYRELDGLRVMNYGSSITVTIGDFATPVGLQYHWRDIFSAEKVGRSMAVDRDSVKEMIKKDTDRVFAKNAVIKIDGIELVYYDNGGEFIQPAYCYRGSGKYKAGGGQDFPVLGYVPALNNPPEPVHHPAFSPEMWGLHIPVEK